MLGGGSVRGVGLGWRPEVAADLLRDPPAVDFVEIVAETCFVQGHARREAEALTAIWPVVPHGVKLSLGSAEGIDDERASRLGRLCRDLKAPVVSEHISFTRGGDVEIGHLTQLPRTRAAVRVVARNVAALRRRLPDIPLLLENVAWSFVWPDDEMDEPTFLAEVARATGCDLLLDLGNLHANARNEGLDPHRSLGAIPLELVAMLHVAGGVEEHGFYFDTHAHPVPDPVFALVEAACRARPGLAVLLERDADFPSFPVIAQELDRLRRARGPCATGPLDAPLRREPPPGPGEREVREDALARAQMQVAALLTAEREPGPDAVDGIEARALCRAREILRRKRVDDALPLLPRLSARGDRLRTIANHALAHLPRARRGTAIADALAIARAATEDEATADLARRDLLVLRARFAPLGRGDELGPRSWPFLGRETLSTGGTVWATKGVGAQAPVHLRERTP